MKALLSAFVSSLRRRNSYRRLKLRTVSFAITFLTLGVSSSAQAPADAPYMNPNLPAGQRAADLVSRMTLEEKVLQMQNSAPAIPRLGVGV